MAILSITIPDDRVPRVRDAFAATFGYPEQVPNPAFDATKIESAQNPRLIPNPQPKMAFAREQVAAFIRSVVREYEVQQAQTAAAAAKASELDTDLAGVG